MILIPIRTGSGLNSREHHMARSRRVKGERNAVGWHLMGKERPQLPCTVLLTRIAPSSGLDSDNLSGALKAARDAVADWLGIDDKDETQVRYAYAQKRGQWGIEVSFGP